MRRIFFWARSTLFIWWNDPTSIHVVQCSSVLCSVALCGGGMIYPASYQNNSRYALHPYHQVSTVYYNEYNVTFKCSVVKCRRRCKIQCRYFFLNCWLLLRESSHKIILGQDSQRKEDGHFDYESALQICALKSLFACRESRMLDFGKKCLKHPTLKRLFP